MNIDLTDPAAIPGQIVANVTGYLATGTIVANVTLAVLVATLTAWLAAMIPAPRGPLHICACGRRYRQGGRETRREFDIRQSAHHDTCPALNQGATR